PEVMPGGWLWLVLLLLLVGLLWFTLSPGSGRIEYGQFMKLVDANAFKRVDVIGNTRIVGTVENRDKIPEDRRNRLRGDTLEALINENVVRSGELTRRLDQAKVLYDFKEEHGAWLGTVLMLILPALLLLAIFFFFLLPRFRDPMGGGFLSSYIK